MMELVRLFLIEEVRLRRSFSTSMSLLVFPELVLVGSLAGYLFIPLLEDSITYAQVHIGIISGLLLFGISMGGIAFLGKEFLERSLGPVNMLAASSGYHPVSERKMFMAYFLHDLLFYLILILVPMTFGMALGTIVRPMPLYRFAVISAAQWSSFLLGLSLSMFVSSILTGRRKLRWALIPASLIPLFTIQVLTGEISGFIPSVLAVNGGTPLWTAATVSLAAIYTAAGVLLYEGGTARSDPEAGGSYEKARIFSSLFMKDPVMGTLLARELINLRRGKAYLRIVFSLFFPLLVMGGLVGLIDGLDSNTIDFNMPFFAVMVSFFTMSVYTNIVNMDFLEFDQTLPVRTGDMIKVKLRLFHIIAVPSAIIFLSLVALFRRDLEGLMFSLPITIVMVGYMGGVTAYLTGLWTNSMLFDATVFLRYLTLTVLPLMIATLLSFLMDTIFLASLVGLSILTVCGLVSTIFLHKALDEKWSDAVLQSAGGV
ncbi:MAG: hypothetical protein ACMUHY_08090 [Thermoplasmatota archaeon]